MGKITGAEEKLKVISCANWYLQGELQNHKIIRDFLSIVIIQLQLRKWKRNGYIDA